MAARHRRRLRQKREQSTSKPFDSAAFMAAVMAKADEACRGLSRVACSAEGDEVDVPVGSHAEAIAALQVGDLVIDERRRVMNERDVDERVRVALLEAMTPLIPCDQCLWPERCTEKGRCLGLGADRPVCTGFVIGDEPFGTRWKDVVGDPLTLGMMHAYVRNGELEHVSLCTGPCECPP